MVAAVARSRERLKARTVQAKVLSNAIWNAINGSSSAVVAVLVPPFLTRLLTPEAYGAWALALQIGTYVSLFGFGIQMAVGRYVAFHEAREDYASRDGIVATAFWFLAGASVVGWLAICGVALAIERLVPNLAADLVGQTQWAIVLVGLALAINLPSSIFAAVFTGRQRSDIPAKIQGLGRLILAVGLVIAGLSRNLAVLGAVYALISIGTVMGLAYAWRTRTHAPTLRIIHVAKRYGAELASFCFSLTLWNFAMLLVSGLDLPIVSRYDYASTAFFAVSVTLMTLVTGTLGSLANALVPAVASIAEGPKDAFYALLARSSRLIMAASILAGAPLIFQGRAILDLWLGPEYAGKAALVLTILASATILRNAMLPYVAVAIGLGYQRKMIATPLAEGAVSVAASVILAQPFGAVGVAIAKIVGGASGVILMLVQHPLREPLQGVSRLTYLRECVLPAALSIIPVAVVDALVVAVLGDRFHLAQLAIVSAVTVASVWMLAFANEDRQFARDLYHRRFRARSRATV